MKDQGQMGLPFETPEDVLLARALLARFGSVSAVLHARRADMERVEGMSETHCDALHLVREVAVSLVRGDAKRRERPVVGSWDAAEALCKARLDGRRTEACLVIFLDRANMLLSDELMWEGTVDHVPVYPREVARRALELGAGAVIVAHNHPSGNVQPSRGDVDMLAKLKAVLEVFDVVLHDGLIVGGGSCLSMRAGGHL